MSLELGIDFSLFSFFLHKGINNSLSTLGSIFHYPYYLKCVNLLSFKIDMESS